MSLPTDSKTRKEIPVYSGFIKYFPDATAAVAQCSFIANEQHSPGEEMHWAKDKSKDELDALMRHMIDDTMEDRDEEGIMHAVKLAWRGMANLQRLADSGVDIFAIVRSTADALCSTEKRMLTPQEAEEYILSLNK